MAKIECELHGNFDVILNALHNAVMTGSSSASIEDSSDFYTGSVRCAVRTYERYSYLGNGRVSMNITLLEADGRIFLSAITSGGSQALFFKINTIGENNFLDTIRNAVSVFTR